MSQTWINYLWHYVNVENSGKTTVVWTLKVAFWLCLNLNTNFLLYLTSLSFCSFKEEKLQRLRFLFNRLPCISSLTFMGIKLAKFPFYGSKVFTKFLSQWCCSMKKVLGWRSQTDSKLVFFWATIPNFKNNFFPQENVILTSDQGLPN